jgi:hypothetical protein
MRKGGCEERFHMNIKMQKGHKPHHNEEAANKPHIMRHIAAKPNANCRLVMILPIFLYKMIRSLVFVVLNLNTFGSQHFQVMKQSALRDAKLFSQFFRTACIFLPDVMLQAFHS